MGLYSNRSWSWKGAHPLTMFRPGDRYRLPNIGKVGNRHTGSGTVPSLWGSRPRSPAIFWLWGRASLDNSQFCVVYFAFHFHCANIPLEPGVLPQTPPIPTPLIDWRGKPPPKTHTLENIGAFDSRLSTWASSQYFQQVGSSYA